MNSRRFYCDFANSRHRDIANVLNKFKLHRDIGAAFFAEKIAPEIAVNITCERALKDEFLLGLQLGRVQERNKRDVLLKYFFLSHITARAMVQLSERLVHMLSACQFASNYILT